MLVSNSPNPCAINSLQWLIIAKVRSIPLHSEQNRVTQRLYHKTFQKENQAQDWIFLFKIQLQLMQCYSFTLDENLARVYTTTGSQNSRSALKIKLTDKQLPIKSDLKLFTRYETYLAPAFKCLCGTCNIGEHPKECRKDGKASGGQGM